MTQKDKVKELVGRGLNSYHTKSLQQMDRIEKKNKEQNHKISILSNELDNDYLTKTEEGSVVSLEHSKEGMVYIDSLEGNTLVNYVTDGSKEMTLNGDIDVEGTSVTLTEGVDNGKVDVMCEGNTLVNWWGNKPANFLIGNGRFENGAIICKAGWCCSKNGKKLKPNTEYTIITNVISITGTNNYLKVNDVSSNGVFINNTEINKVNKVGIYKDKLTTRGTIDEQTVFDTRSLFSGDGEIKFNMIVLEGDWTNKEIPQYFEGMKSVGECEDNKIEILSQSKNLFDSNNITQNKYIIGQVGMQSGYGSYGDSVYTDVSDYIPVKQGKAYVFSYEYETLSNVGVRAYCYYDNNKNIIIPKTDTTYDVSKKSTTYTPQQDGYIRIAYDKNCTNIQFEQSDVKTSYSSYAINKKEILINAPLRAVNNVKDKFVKIGNKWFIERNNIEIVCNGNENWTYSSPVFRLSVAKYPHKEEDGNSVMGWGICDRYSEIRNIIGSKDYAFKMQSQSIQIRNKDFTDVDSFKSHLNSNPIKVVYQLATPIYEPLEIEPVLNTYNDVTHISNNSIIPCNMKIKNSGYNAIIKPSTLYTVALDTNKSGTVGMNLGGAKATTTNNVATITTPATLTDDSLRIYGKGIKGSKVRLLEGDKTNWIPSFFEGMKSSFEDKLQDDGSYKMEILSNNKNLFRIKDVITYNSGQSVVINENSITITQQLEGDWKYYGYGLSHLKPNTKYTVSANIEGDANATKVRIFNWYNNKEVTSFSGNNFRTFTTPNDTSKLAILLYTSYNISKPIGTVGKFTNIMIEEGDKTSYVPSLLNKIQFSSIEPLRGVGDVKDRFVFKDGKLMIERFYKQIIFDGSENWIYKEDNIDGYIYNCDIPDLKLYGTNSIKQGLMDKFGMRGHTNFCAFFEYVGGKNINIKLPYAMTSPNKESIKQWISENNIKLVYELENPVYEEIPFELQKIILEGYENGTLFFDTNIPPTSTVTYAGETPIVKATRLNKTEVLNNTEDINDNIIPYLMDMDYRVVMLQLATEELEGGVSMARLFGGTYEMIKRDILSKRLTREEYGYRLADYFNAGKLTEEQVRELEELR